MEPVTVIVILSLLFGGAEHLRAEHHKDNSEMYQAKYEEAIEVNERNSETITELSAIHDKTMAVLEETKSRQDYYERINADNEARIKELEGVVATYDWSSERIPLEIVDYLGTD